MAPTRSKTSWWAFGRDLETFRLAKFFTLTSFVVILVFTVILTLILAHRAQKMSLAKSEEYLKLLAANLNHQVFQGGGVTVILMPVPSWFQIPSLLDPFTRKIYSPAGRLV